LPPPEQAAGAKSAAAVVSTSKSSNPSSSGSNPLTKIERKTFSSQEKAIAAIDRFHDEAPRLRYEENPD